MIFVLVVIGLYIVREQRASLEEEALPMMCGDAQDGVMSDDITLMPWPLFLKSAFFAFARSTPLFPLSSLDLDYPEKK